MTTQHDKTKRWRPRFSVRTLVVVVTLVCCYAACWGPTKRDGVEDVLRYVNSEPIALRSASLRSLLPTGGARATTPLLVGIDEWPGTSRSYYFWFFGYVAKLPYEHQQPVTPSPHLTGLIDVLLP